MIEAACEWYLRRKGRIALPSRFLGIVVAGPGTTLIKELNHSWVIEHAWDNVILLDGAKIDTSRVLNNPRLVVVDGSAQQP